MKRKDIALIVVIVFISALISYVISGMIFSSPKSHKQQVEVVEPISTNFPQPDNRYFNKNAFDPTKQITIGQGTNTDPFSGTSH